MISKNISDSLDNIIYDLCCRGSNITFTLGNLLNDDQWYNKNADAIIFSDHVILCYYRQNEKIIS